MKPASLVLDHVQITRPGRPALPGAVVVANGQVTWIGPGEVPRSALPPRTMRIDCEGGALTPGFVDAHCHPLALGAALTAADCRPAAARTIPEIQRQLASWAAANSAARFVRGFGYDELLLREHRHPNRHDLDAVVADRPVVLTHGSGHALVLNTAGLRAAGITESTDEPAGGFIDREEDTGVPGGLLLDMGSHVLRRLGRPTDAEVRRYASAASEALTHAGVTSVVDAGPSNDVAIFERWAEFRKDQTFQPRMTVMQAAGSPTPEAEIARFAAWVDAGPTKIILIRGKRGGTVPAAAELDEMVATALAGGIGVAVHAIEAESILTVCRAFAEAKRRLGPGIPSAPAYLRIEHAAEATPDVCAAIKGCGASVVTQPGFVYGRGDRYLAAAGAGGWPVDHLYPLRTLLDQGIPVMFGSDAPYGPVSPLDAIYGAVTRTSASGRPVGRSQAIGTADAMARSVNWSSLRAGSRGDLAVLSKDPQSVDPERLRDLTVRLTIVGGEIVWRA